MTTDIISRLYGMSSLEDVYEARRDIGKNAATLVEHVDVASVCRRLVRLGQVRVGRSALSAQHAQPELAFDYSAAASAAIRLAGQACRKQASRIRIILDLQNVTECPTKLGPSSPNTNNRHFEWQQQLSFNFHCQRLQRGEAEVVVHGASDDGGKGHRGGRSIQRTSCFP